MTGHFKWRAKTRQMNTRFDLQTITLVPRLGRDGMLAGVLLVDASPSRSTKRHVGGIARGGQAARGAVKAQHHMLREVHPAVEKIEESVKDVAVAVSEEDSSGKAVRR